MQSFSGTMWRVTEARAFDEAGHQLLPLGLIQLALSFLKPSECSSPLEMAEHGRSHGAGLMPTARELLEACGARFADLAASQD